MTKKLAKTPRLYQKVAEKLIQLIKSKEFSVGDRLPAERELAATFSVSRPTIREAVIALELENYVEVRMGSGVYVINDSNNKSSLSDKDVGPFELTEARALFEGEAAALAATMITDEELQELSETLKAIDNRNVSEAEAADKKFHMIIANATNNSAISSVIEMLWDQRDGSVLTHSFYEKVRYDVTPTVEAHYKIYEALKNHDAKSAREAMRGHLMRVINDMLEATEVEAMEAARKKVTENRNRYGKSRQLS